VAIIVVGGSGRGVGKTALVCGLIAALPEFAWTAVKITSHAHGKPESIWEETEPAGQGTDTARYLAAGARRALLVRAPEETFPFRRIQDALKLEPHVIFESNRIVNHLKPDVCLGVLGGRGVGAKGSFAAFLGRTDALVAPVDADLTGLAPGIPLFRWAAVGIMPPAMPGWVRARLSGPRPS
jgi:hypothetical protein